MIAERLDFRAPQLPRTTWLCHFNQPIKTWSTKLLLILTATLLNNDLLWPTQCKRAS